jgi:siroheme synthase
MNEAPGDGSAVLYPVGLTLLDRRVVTPVAVVADGSTTTQRTVRTTLAELPRAMADEGIRPPAVWVVGDVVGLPAATLRTACRVAGRTETPSGSFPQP